METLQCILIYCQQGNHMYVSNVSGRPCCIHEQCVYAGGRRSLTALCVQGVVHPPLGLRPPPPLPEPEPELLERQDSALSLNADAAPFVPTFG